MKAQPGEDSEAIGTAPSQPATRKVAFLASRGSRRGRALFDSLKSTLGDRLVYSQLVGKSNEWSKAIKRCVEAGAEVIAVGGGDGTVHYAAPLIAKAGAVLSIIPLGTGNALARELNVPLAPKDALLLAIESGEVREIDGGVFNQQPFLTVATTGLTARIANAVSTSPKKLFGRFVYIPAVLKAAFLARSFPISVKADEHEFSGKAWLVVVANSRTHGGPFIATPEASLTNGKLGVYVVAHERKGVLLTYFWNLLRGRHTELEEVWAQDAETVVIKAKRARTFIVDGEKVKCRIAEMKCDQKAFRIVVPLED
ncbi:MAG: hypothetical protein KF812_02905 [Fimbriimonadaceae bacterium]|nr:hypothetical protein [Fimbriimonadaceae bacterium]